MSDQGIFVKVFARTDVGNYRDHNEDAFRVANLTTEEHGLTPTVREHEVGENGSLFMICDGMGGAAAGEVASNMAVEEIYRTVIQPPKPQTRLELARRLIWAIDAANMAIFRKAEENPSMKGMGTTATVAAVHDRILIVGQIGDSRSYIIRKGRAYRMTKDQSLLQRLIDAGHLTEEAASQSMHQHVILQALGVKQSIDVVLTISVLAQGDQLLLCSDGLTDVIPDEDIARIITENSSLPPSEVCKILTEEAKRRDSTDNITVILARFEGADLPLPSRKKIEYVELDKEHLEDEKLLTQELFKEDTQVLASFMFPHNDKE